MSDHIEELFDSKDMSPEEHDEIIGLEEFQVE